MIDNRTVGRTIATLRQAKGMTQQQLAAAMNVSHQAVSKWENGAALPDIQTLVELTQLFGITVEQLLSGEIPEARLEEEEKSSSIDEHFQRFGSFVGNVVEDIGNVFKAEAAEAEIVSEEPEEKPEDEAEGSGENGHANIDFKKLLEMAPFMSKKTVSEMVEKSGKKLTAAEIARIAPYVEAAQLEKLIRESESEITWDNLRRFAPFLKKEVVDAFARTIALGEKYVKPVSNEVGRVADDVWKTMDDVSRKIEKGVDKAIRKVVKFGENAVNEVTKAFDDLTSETMTRDERIAKLRRSAFERAVDDGRWDWIAAHIQEVQDEELRCRIAEAANRQGMQDWIAEHLSDYADPDIIDTAIAENDWDWLGARIDWFDGPTQRRIAKAAMQAEKWDWLSACAEQIEMGEIAAEIAGTARRAGAKELAAQLVRYDMDADSIKTLASEAAADGDIDFVEMIKDMLVENGMLDICTELAKSGRWDDVERLSQGLGMESIESLMETAIDMGDFDAIDRIDALLQRNETEDEQQ